jgi:nitroreductase
MNETLKTMWKRRSVRRYQETGIPDEDLRLILEAARRAPTGANRQNWRMVVVRDKDLRHETAEACNGQMWMADAAVILCMVVLPGQGKVNGAIVLDHAVLAASSLGYGTCWIGAYDAAKVRAVLGIPDDHDIVNLVPVGVPAEEPKARGRKQPSELFFDDRFGASLDYTPVELAE